MSSRSSCRGIPDRLAGRLLSLVLAALAAGPAGAVVEPFFVDTGPLTISVDAGGSSFGSHVIQVDKPSDTALVRTAFVFAVSSFERVIEDGAVEIDDVDVTWDFSASPANTHILAAYADVTDLVAPKIDAAPAGRIDFRFTEFGATTIDGEVLAVIFEDPEQSETRTIWLAFGGSSGERDDLVVTLREPIDPDAPGAVADLGLGISFSVHGEPGLTTVPRFVEVDDKRLSSAAGGQDDGCTTPGSRITAGGLDDDDDNPSAPFALPGEDERLDDELYSLLPFLSADLTRLTVSTFPDPDADDVGVFDRDNFFFAYFVFSRPAAVGAGVFLEQETAESPVGADHTVTASVVDDQGEPAAEVEVAFEVVEGPNVGTTGTMTTDDDGVAVFTYTGDGGAGDDVVEASIVETVEILDLDAVLRSNSVRHEWVTFAVDLEPMEQTLEVGSFAPLGALVTLGTSPAAGVAVDFTVVSGPNEGIAGSVVTENDGIAIFTYKGLGGTGVDEVEASVTDATTGIVIAATAEVTWIVAVLEPRPDVAVNAAGDILVVGEAGAGLSDVVAVFVDRDGSPLTTFDVNEAIDVHRSPAAAALADGGFMVVFVAGREAPNALLGRRIGVAGALAEVFTVAESDDGAIASPDVAALAGGGFAVVWEQGGSLAGRAYDAGGQPLGPTFVVAGGAVSSLEPALAVPPDDSLAVAYTALSADDSDTIRLARLGLDGELLADVEATRFSGGMQANPAVTAAGARPFVFWETFSDVTGAGIFARLDPEDGARPELQVNSVIAGDQLWPAATVEPSGLVAAAWLDAPRNVVAAQRLAPGLAFADGEVEVELTAFLGVTGGPPVLGRPRLAALADGGLVIAVGVAGDATDPDGGVAVGFVDPSPLAECFEDGRLVCVKARGGPRTLEAAGSDR